MPLFRSHLLTPLILRPLLLLALSGVLELPHQVAAQAVNLTVAGSLGTGHLSGTIQPALGAGLTVRNVAVWGGFGLSARLLADLGRGGGLELSGLFDVPLADSADRLTFYAGPGLALSFRGPAELRPSLSAGLRYELNGQIDLFAEASYRVPNSLRSRAGITYSF
jgi:hypothetical protein